MQVTIIHYDCQAVSLCSKLSQDPNYHIALKFFWIQHRSVCVYPTANIIIFQKKKEKCLIAGHITELLVSKLPKSEKERQ